MTENQDNRAEPAAAEHSRSEHDDPQNGDTADSFTLAGPGWEPAGPAGPPDYAAAQGAAPDYDKYGVPSLDFVRNKIEGRYATSMSAAELAQQTWEATSAQQREAERERAAREALERIRQSLRDHKQS